jgi:hypothetical protein
MVRISWIVLPTLSNAGLSIALCHDMCFVVLFFFGTAREDDSKDRSVGPIGAYLKIASGKEQFATIAGGLGTW